MNFSYNSSIGVPEASLSSGDDSQSVKHSVHSSFDDNSSPSDDETNQPDEPQDAEMVYTQQPMLASASPFMIIILIVVLILFFILFSSLADPSSPASSDMGFDSDMSSPSSSSSGSSSASIKVLSAIMWGTFIVVVLLNGLQYFYNINFTAKLSNLFSMSPAMDITVDPLDTSVSVPPVPEITISKQVFHIPGNKYDYENAEALCKAYGARLASYSEVENAYTNGGEWCSYGWSKDQMALFPTQKSTWTELQSIKGHENDCGRPGVNGGYIANKNVRFGANCYGYKPKMNQAEKDMMDASSIYPKTVEDIKQEKRVEYWKRKIPDILVSPFNNKVWSLL
jgi:hypothetical protein